MNREYKVEICLRDGIIGRDHYTKVAGEVVFIHEHRVVDGKEKFYNAIKLETGEWVESLNSIDKAYVLYTDKDENKLMVLTDDSSKFLGSRPVYLVK